MLRIRSYLTALMATCLLLVGGPILGTAPESRAENVQLNQDIPMQMQILVTPLTLNDNDIVVRRLVEIGIALSDADMSRMQKVGPNE